MKQIKSAKDVLRLGTILTVWAHPDDESLLAAGIMNTAVNNGQKVICVTATKGEAGIQDSSKWSSSNLGEVRAKEQAKALSILDVQNCHCMDYPDTKCQKVEQGSAVTRIEAFINLYDTDTILTFGPDGWTGNPDHKAVSKWVARAVKNCNKRIQVFHVVGTPYIYDNYLRPEDEKINIFYNIQDPPIVEPRDCDICFSVSGEVLERKYQALKSMPSQYEKLFKSFDKDFLMKSWSIEAFVKAN